MYTRLGRATVGLAGALALGSAALGAAAPASAQQGFRNICEGCGNSYNAVWCVQIAVNVTADGNFGPTTKQGVKNFQSKRGLAVDGVVGPATGNYIVSVDTSKGHGNCYNYVPTTY